MHYWQSALKFVEEVAAEVEQKRIHQAQEEPHVIPILEVPKQRAHSVHVSPNNSESEGEPPKRSKSLERQATAPIEQYVASSSSGDETSTSLSAYTRSLGKNMSSWLKGNPSEEGKNDPASAAFSEQIRKLEFENQEMYREALKYSERAASTESQLYHTKRLLKETEEKAKNARIEADNLLTANKTLEASCQTMQTIQKLGYTCEDIILLIERSKALEQDMKQCYEVATELALLRDELNVCKQQLKEERSSLQKSKSEIRELQCDLRASQKTRLQLLEQLNSKKDDANSAKSFERELEANTSQIISQLEKANENLTERLALESANNSNLRKTLREEKETAAATIVKYKEEIENLDLKFKVESETKRKLHEEECKKWQRLLDSVTNRNMTVQHIAVPQLESTTTKLCIVKSPVITVFSKQQSMDTIPRGPTPLTVAADTEKRLNRQNSYMDDLRVECSFYKQECFRLAEQLQSCK